MNYGAIPLRNDARAGEMTLEEVYDRYAGPLFRYALALTGSRDDAEDAVQEVFARVAKERRRMAGVESPKAYLYTAVRHASFVIIRGRRRGDKLRDAMAFDAGARVWAEEDTHGVDPGVVREAFMRLPMDQREVVALKALDGMTFKEIAEVTHTSMNTVMSRYRYGVEKLRRELEVEDDG